VRHKPESVIRVAWHPPGGVSWGRPRHQRPMWRGAER